MSKEIKNILVNGNNRLICSIAVNMLQSGYSVTILTDEIKSVTETVKTYQEDCAANGIEVFSSELDITTVLPSKRDFDLSILITEEDLSVKRDMINGLCSLLPEESIIAVNTESIPLELIQKYCARPERVVGLNWTEPAHTTFFLEIIANEQVDEKIEEQILFLSRDKWNKSPYVIHGEIGIRSRIFSSMVREAFYLVEHGYASVEDIDRAFRNDPGFYLPFCGNIRYMDLMGTYAYGLVMKELNRELSTSKETPSFFNELIDEGSIGMDVGRGFYDYTQNEEKKWEDVFRKFSFQMKKLMNKYPFEY